MGSDRDRRLPAGPGAGLNAEEAAAGRQVAALAVRLHAMAGRRPSYVPGTEDLDAGHPFYRFADGMWTYEARERGDVVFRRRTPSVRELLGWIASGMARDVATRHELEHRVEGQDPRRMWFALWERLTRALDPEWGEEVRREIAEVLEIAPYRD